MILKSSLLLTLCRKHPFQMAMASVATFVTGGLTIALSLRILLPSHNWIGAAIYLTTTVLMNIGIACLWALVSELMDRDKMLCMSYRMKTGEDIDQDDAPVIVGASSRGVVGQIGSLQGSLAAARQAAQYNQNNVIYPHQSGAPLKYMNRPVDPNAYFAALNAGMPPHEAAKFAAGVS